LAFLLLAVPVFGQQDYVGRYNVFAGFTYLDSPQVHLPERGFHIQAGLNLKTWLAMGFDYSRSTGELTLTPNLLPDALRSQLEQEIAAYQSLGLLPAGYVLSVPAGSTTQTFAAGPQFSWRHWTHLTLFIRPSIGAIREVARPHPADPFAAGVVQSLAPSGTKQDWTYFYGFGGGADIGVTRHLALRVQADLVRDHLFNDILKNSRGTVRLSIGPTIQWGHNIVQ
jgi:hypothetical protein